MKLVLDCRDGMGTIHDQLSQALDFPHWYGRNLDALHDCLTERPEGISIVLLHPELLPGLYRVLQDCAAQNPHIHITVI